MTRYRRTYDTRPRGMAARYAGKCASCGTDIKPGDPMVWAPATRYAHCGRCGESLLYGVAREDSYAQYGTDVMADYR